MKIGYYQELQKKYLPLAYGLVYWFKLYFKCFINVSDSVAIFTGFDDFRNARSGSPLFSRKRRQVEKKNREVMLIHH